MRAAWVAQDLQRGVRRAVMVTLDHAQAFVRIPEP